MKKTLLLAILLLPTFAFATIDSNLKYGSRGVEVTELQEFLIDKGFLTGQPTGNFFALTKKAVISYQKSLNLPATGFVGQLTRAEINKELEVNNEAEIQETGAVNQPVSNNVDDLLKKIADITEQQKAQQEQTNKLIESIKPEPKVSGVISIPQPVDKSEIIVEDLNSKKNYEVNFRPYGGFDFAIYVKDFNGNYLRNATITMDAPKQAHNFNPTTRSDSSGMKIITDSNGNKVNAYITYLTYDPATFGSQNITFTANGMSKTITINVPDKPYINEYREKINDLQKQIMERMGLMKKMIPSSPEEIKEWEEIRKMISDREKLEQDFANSVPLTN